MQRVCLALVLLTACGVEEDDRPLELDYLTSAIFAPSCGASQCHSSFRQAAKNVFDTPERTRQSLIANGLIRFDSEKYDPDDPNNANLIIWITEIDPFGAGVGRMPFDAPLANKNVELLREWISVAAPGAQCDPRVNGGNACNSNEVVACSADWTFGARVQLCSNGCALGVCL